MSGRAAGPEAREATFSGRWGMMLAMLGMAVGTGNIWRFPRIAATNGGGDFLIPWVVFLFSWSLPLILTEFALGKAMRRGPVGAFGRLLGPGFRWMGGWVAFCASAIMFYYSVVTGWCLRYVWAAVAGEVPGREPGAFWEAFSGSPGALVTHLLAMGLAVAVVWRGVRGIERAARVLMPTLFALIVLLALRAVTLPGAERGLEFLFRPDWDGLRDAEIWLNALTQNAWDTGAGWGLIVSYAVYMRTREDTTLNAFMLGFGNNSVSLLAGIMVLCTVFSIRPEAAGEIVGAGNTGLTFTWMPQLFATIPLGRLFMALFFVALLAAALTSLISMVELAVRALTDGGMRRGPAIAVVA
ncbi:MAG: sodium-dependent transporter, partial [Gemmatimonadota bacterium]